MFRHWVKVMDDPDVMKQKPAVLSGLNGTTGNDTKYMLF